MPIPRRYAATLTLWWQYSHASASSYATKRYPLISCLNEHHQETNEHSPKKLINSHKLPIMDFSP
jgi:hypothetical protein